MKALYAFLARNALRGLIALAALGGVPIAIAAPSPAFNAFNGVAAGNSVAVHFGGPGSPLPTSPPSGASTLLGNMGISSSSPMGPLLEGSVKAPLGDTGKAVQVAAKAKVNPVAFMRGLRAAVGGPGGLALLALPFIVDYINDTERFRVNPITGEVEKKELESCSADCVEFELPGGGWSRSLMTSCSAHLAYSRDRGGAYFRAVTFVNKTTCSYEYSFSQSAPTWAKSQFSPPSRTTTDTWANWLPSSLDDIAEYMDEPEASRLPANVVQEGFTKAGIDPFGAAGPIVGTPTVSGPSSAPGARTQTSSQTRVHPGTTTEVAPGTTGETQPATRTNTTTTTHNVTYNNNVVTYNTTTINNTTITNNVTGQTDTTTDETVTEDDAKPEEDKPDLCQKNPDILACQKPDLDTPDGEIPKSTVDVTYQIEDTWGSGACPASLYANINGQSVMVYDWPQTCSIVATYVRPLLLLMCALGALFIVMPGKAD